MMPPQRRDSAQGHANSAWLRQTKGYRRKRDSSGTHRLLVTRVSVAVRDKHVADLVNLTRPGGALILVSDVVSTHTAPELSKAAADDLQRHLSVCIAAKNFFTGTNPYRILDLLQTSFRDSVTDIRLVDPWLWAVTPDRQHLTYAIVARRRRNEYESTAAASSSPPRVPRLRP